MFPLDGNVAHVSAVCGVLERGHEGECYLIGLSITLHRVQIHHEVKKETSLSSTRKSTATFKERV